MKICDQMITYFYFIFHVLIWTELKTFKLVYIYLPLVYNPKQSLSYMRS